jgi:hypothetical protein
VFHCRFRCLVALSEVGGPKMVRKLIEGAKPKCVDRRVRNTSVATK